MCPFCETSAAPPQPSVPRQAAPSEEPEWRREVARRLEVYRSRRDHVLSGDDSGHSQPALPFNSRLPEVITTAVAPRTIARIRPTQHVEIHVSQPELDFSVVENYRLHPAKTSLPVAELSTRRLAGIIDAVVVAAVFVGFLGLFRSLGGQLGFARPQLAVYAAVFFLIYVLYFTLFTLFSGMTPGMQIRNLSTVAIDGTFPETRQLLWRSFGYVLSAGTVLLGFLWALWDEDKLTWHDRMSHTYITHAADSSGDDSAHD